MGANSKIEWTHHTFNPWIGCQKVSAGCDHCYAETQNAFRKWNGGTWGPHAPRKRTSEANWNQPLKWNEAAKRDGVRRRVFCASLADWLDNQVPYAWRLDLAILVHGTQNLDWLLLTKRIENYAEHAPWLSHEVPPNVWLGVTAEDQANYDRRWPILARIGDGIKFISYEPAIGPLDVGRHVLLPDWLICGGESGSQARPMQVEWARKVRDDCAGSGIPFHFKQWGEWWDAASNGPAEFRGTKHEDDRMVRVGKKRAGRLLDGEEHNAFPRITA